MLSEADLQSISMSSPSLTVCVRPDKQRFLVTEEIEAANVKALNCISSQWQPEYFAISSECFRHQLFMQVLLATACQLVSAKQVLVGSFSITHRQLCFSGDQPEESPRTPSKSKVSAS